jgi:hypothetical protein
MKEKPTMNLERIIDQIKTVIDNGGDNIEERAKDFLKIAINALKNAETVIDLNGEGDGCIVPIHFGGIPQEAVDVVLDMSPNIPVVAPNPMVDKTQRPPYNFGDLTFEMNPLLVEAFQYHLHAATPALLGMYDPGREINFNELSIDAAGSLLLSEVYFDHEGKEKDVDDLDIIQFWTTKSEEVKQAKTWPQVLLFPVDQEDGSLLIEFFKIHRGNFKAVRAMRDAIRVERKEVQDEKIEPALIIS